jgi:DEAD/DEAH box helicase domain-containing protein
LNIKDTVYDIDELQPVIKELEGKSVLVHDSEGERWFSKKRFPHREVNIRDIGGTFRVFSGGRCIGDISGTRVYREAHPGAIYLHRGAQYRIEELNLECAEVHASEVDVDYYTQAIVHEDTEVLREVKKKNNISWGNLKTTHKVTGYWKKRLLSREKIAQYQLELPSWTFETQGLWIKLNRTIEKKLIQRDLDFAGGLHALEHVLIAALPLFAMCDKGDIGGISYTVYPLFGAPAIFVYDGFQDGIGLTKRGFEVLEDWLNATQGIMTECTCEDGCPSCVQDPQCGSGNEPLDKVAALFILEEIKRL